MRVYSYEVSLKLMAVALIVLSACSSQLKVMVKDKDQGTSQSQDPSPSPEAEPGQEASNTDADPEDVNNSESQVLDETPQTPVPPALTLNQDDATVISRSIVAAAPLSGTCNIQGAAIEVDVGAGGLQKATTCSGGMWEVSVDLSSWPEGPVAIVVTMTVVPFSPSSQTIQMIKDTRYNYAIRSLSPQSMQRSTHGANFGSSVSIAEDQLTMVVGESGHQYDGSQGQSLINAGAVFVYTRVDTSSPWTFSQKLIAYGTNGRNAGDFFGLSVNISGDLIAVGAPWHSYDANGSNFMEWGVGAVFTFMRNAGTWSPAQKIVPSGVNARRNGNNFGKVMSLHGSTLAVGVGTHSYNVAGVWDYSTTMAAGSAFIFVWDGSQFTQQQRIMPISQSNNFCGTSIAVYQDTLAMGCPGRGMNGGSHDDKGSVVILTRSGVSWSLQQEVVSSGTNSNRPYDRFGTTLDLDGDTLAVGAPGQDFDAAGDVQMDNAGAVFVFVRSGVTWSQQARLVGFGANGRLADDTFSSGISLSGDKLAVAAFAQDYDSSGDNFLTDAGAIYTYSRSGTIWSNLNKKTGFGTNGRNADDRLSAYHITEYRSFPTGKLDMVGNLLVVGVINQDFDGAGAEYIADGGAVYTFSYDSITPKWDDGVKIAEPVNYKSLPVQNGRFGDSVALSDDELTLVVGATGDSLDANGANPVYGAGSAFVYTRPNLSAPWALQQKLTPSGTDSRKMSYGFGSATAIDGDTIAVSAPIPGNEWAIFGGGALIDLTGSVYIFRKNNNLWEQESRLTPVLGNLATPWIYFGHTLSLHQNTIAVGAPYDNLDENEMNDLFAAGSVYIYTRTGSSWGLQQKIVANGLNGRNSSDNFGISLVLHDNTLICGSPNHNFDSMGNNPEGISYAGTIFVLGRSGSVWTQTHRITAPQRHDSAGFGSAIALDQDTLAVGASGERLDKDEMNDLYEAGAIYTYVHSGSNWTFQNKISAPNDNNNRMMNDNFGRKLALSQGYLIVGVSKQDYDVDGGNYIEGAGAAFVFARQGSSWNFINKLVAPPGNLGRVTPPYSIFYTYSDTGLFDAFAFKGLTVVGGFASSFFDSTGTIQTAGAGAIFTFQAP